MDRVVDTPAANAEELDLLRKRVRSVMEQVGANTDRAFRAVEPELKPRLVTHATEPDVAENVILAEERESCGAVLVMVADTLVIDTVMEENMPIKKICAWCKTVLQEGDEPASHGICEMCKAIEMRKFKNIKGEA